MKRLSIFVLFLLSGAVLSQESIPSCQVNLSSVSIKSREAPQYRILLKETVGPVVSITELDLASLLQRRVLEASKLGLVREQIDKTRKAMRNHAREPVSLNLPHAKVSKSWHFTLMRESDIKNVSPEVLESLKSQKRSYAFFDADNARHRKWAMEISSNTNNVPLRLVSVTGDRIAFEKETGFPLFSDQGGVLVRRFGVKEIPALVQFTYREGVGQTFCVNEEEL